MITGLYTAASGMVVQMRNQDILAYNLGNSLIPGFKRDSMIIRSFPDVLLQQCYAGISPSLEQPRYAHTVGRIGTGAGVDWVYTDSSPGQTVYTGDPNDVAVIGDGYFTVLTPDGMRYTRNGRFYRDKDGYLSSTEGHHLAGQGLGPGQGGQIQGIRIPTGQFTALDLPGRPTVTSTNRFAVRPDGRVYVVGIDPNGAEVHSLVDQIRIVDFRDRNILLKEGNNLYSLEPGHESEIIPPRNLRLAQGYIERSNCIPTTEMLHLMESMRNFEANSRVVRKIDDTLRRAVNDVGRVG